MKKCTCIEKWRWGTIDKRIVYAAAALFFSIGILVDATNEWDKPANYMRVAIVTFNLCGFLMMVFYQFLNKWIVGSILVTIIAMISIIPFGRAIKNYVAI